MNSDIRTNIIYELILFNFNFYQNFFQFLNRISSLMYQIPLENMEKKIFKVIQGKTETENESVSSFGSSGLFKNKSNDSFSDKEKNTNFIGFKRGRIKRPRKDNRDNIRRKIKGGFFNRVLINKLNNKLKKIGSIDYFMKFPKCFVWDGNRNNNKIIFDLTLLEIFENKEFYTNENKKGLINYEHNLKVILSGEIKKNEEIKKILNKTISELYEEYINSDEFNINEITRLKEKKMRDDYIKNYKYLAKHLLEYLSQ